MSEGRHWRHLDIVNPDELTKPITVIGAGAIGSFTVLSLAKIGCSDISVYDFDTVELHNLGNQFYRTQDLEKPKVEALKDLVKDFEDIEITAHNEKFNGQKIKPGILIVSVDDMDTRIEIWKRFKEKFGAELYIDARMGGEAMRIYTIDPIDGDDVEFYEKNLYPSNKALELPCSAKSIMYNVLCVSSFVVNNIKKYAMKQVYEREIIFDMKTMNLMLLQ